MKIIIKFVAVLCIMFIAISIAANAKDKEPVIKDTKETPNEDKKKNWCDLELVTYDGSTFIFRCK